MKRFACVPARAVFDLQLQPVLVRTLLALGLHTDGRGCCHVKRSTLAAVLGTTVKHVQHYLHELEELGYVRVTPQFWPHGGQRENAYELVLGGGPAPDPEGGSEHGPRHKERVLGTWEKSPALLGPGEENLDVDYIDLRETEGVSATMPERQKTRPTKPKTAKKPDRWNPVTLSQYFVNRARSHQWGHAAPASAKELAGNFRRWRDNNGVTYREIAMAIDVFFSQLPPNLEAPAGRVFIKQGFQWIAAAKEEIYLEDLPAKQQANRDLWDRVYESLDIWLADNPDVTRDQTAAMKAALYKELSRVNA